MSHSRTRLKLYWLSLFAVVGGVWIADGWLPAVATGAGLVLAVFLGWAGSNLREAQMWLLEARFYLPIVVFAVVAFGTPVLKPDRAGTLSFYEAAVQVIALLVLALGFEARSSVRTHIRTRDDFTGISLTLGFLGLGGYYALSVLATERPTPEEYQVVTASIAAGAAGVFVAALLNPETDPGPTTQQVLEALRSGPMHPDTDPSSSDDHEDD